MADKATSIVAGTLICFSSGEYSDYGYCGHFVTLQELTNDGLAEAKEKAEAAFAENDAKQDAWTRESGEPYPQSISKQEAFIAALIRSGHLLSLAVWEIHLGSYGDLEAFL